MKTTTMPRPQPSALLLLTTVLATLSTLALCAPLLAPATSSTSSRLIRNAHPQKHLQPPRSLLPATPALRAGDDDKKKDDEKLSARAIIAVVTPVLIVLAVCVVFVLCLRTGDKAVEQLGKAKSRRNSLDARGDAAGAGTSLDMQPGAANPALSTASVGHGQTQGAGGAPTAAYAARGNNALEMPKQLTDTESGYSVPVYTPAQDPAAVAALQAQARAQAQYAR